MDENDDLNEKFTVPSNAPKKIKIKRRSLLLVNAVKSMHNENPNLSSTTTSIDRPLEDGEVYESSNQYSPLESKQPSRRKSVITSSSLGIGSVPVDVSGTAPKVSKIKKSSLLLAGIDKDKYKLEYLSQMTNNSTTNDTANSNGSSNSTSNNSNNTTTTATGSGSGNAATNHRGSANGKLNNVDTKAMVSAEDNESGQRPSLLTSLTKSLRFSSKNNTPKNTTENGNETPKSLSSVAVVAAMPPPLKQPPPPPLPPPLQPKQSSSANSEDENHTNKIEPGSPSSSSKSRFFSRKPPPPPKENNDTNDGAGADLYNIYPSSNHYAVVDVTKKPDSTTSKPVRRISTTGGLALAARNAALKKERVQKPVEDVEI